MIRLLHLTGLNTHLMIVPGRPGPLDLTLAALAVNTERILRLCAPKDTEHKEIHGTVLCHFVTSAPLLVTRALLLATRCIATSS